VVVELEVEEADEPPDITNAPVTVRAITMVNARSTYVLNDDAGFVVSKTNHCTSYPLHHA
jgi:hypothetical protein